MERETGKVVVMHGFSQDEALIVMRAIKSALKVQNEVAFAMSTETNMAWKLSDLVEHVREEHEFMTQPQP